MIGRPWHRTRRPGAALVVIAAIAGVVVAAPATGPVNAQSDHRVIVLGIDGMDHRLLTQFIDEGRMPNFAQLAATGDFAPLQTSMPPLSPVAWSNFITGMDPGGHGIFDFVHRDPATFEQFNPIARVAPTGRTLKLGSWEFPVSGGGYELLRKGTAVWELLEDAGVPTTVFRMPVNFPPVKSGGRSVSGMGTPDILGTSGTYSYYTDYPPENMHDLAGAAHLVDVVNNRVTAQLVGPPNTFRRFPVDDPPARVGAGEIEYENPDLTVDFEVFLDPEAPAAKLIVQDHEFVLNEGEWSDWISIDFEMVPFLVSISTSARFYLQEIRPDFKLYVTPLQIDPANPALPISTPDDWSAEVSAQIGRFYTQELPEDTDAFLDGIFTARDFWDQSQFIYQERRRALDNMLDTFDEGFLFFYFSSVDQGSHMLYHFRDPEHPAFEVDDLLATGMRTLYEEMDEALGRVLEEVDERTTLIVMSDHGFAPFYWGVHLNSWLLERGYVTLKDPSRQGQLPLYLNVDWSQTTAYALGLQGLYVNLRGRDMHGVVSPGAEHQQLLDRLETDLLAMVDDRNGQSPVQLVYRTQAELHGPYMEEAPDIVVGYSRGYRATWATFRGEFPREIFIDNDEAWSGDHQNDYRLVPGVLLTNRRIALDTPALYDLTVAVLNEFGVAPLPEMIGEDAIEDR